MQHNLDKRLYEHKRDVKNNNTLNAIFCHIMENDHRFDFNNVTLLKPIHNKSTHRLIESPLISQSTNTIKQ